MDDRFRDLGGHRPPKVDWWAVRTLPMELKSGVRRDDAGSHEQASSSVE